jgi:tetratricopeptide (TPR) repeat protein
MLSLEQIGSVMMFSLRIRRAVRERTPEELGADATRNWGNGRFDEGFDRHERAISSFNSACHFFEGAVGDYVRCTERAGTEGLPADATELRPLNTAECRYWLGCSQSAIGRYPEAVANLESAAAQFEVSHTPLRAGESYLMLGAALRDQALEQDSRSLFLAALDKFDAADRLFFQALKSGNDEAEAAFGQSFLSSAPAYLALGDCDTVINRYPKAMAVFQKYGDRQQQRWCEGHYQTALCMRTVARGIN